jgi:hypothetical protein
MPNKAFALSPVSPLLGAVAFARRGAACVLPRFGPAVYSYKGSLKKGVARVFASRAAHLHIALKTKNYAGKS